MNTRNDKAPAPGRDAGAWGNGQIVRIVTIIASAVAAGNLASIASRGPVAADMLIALAGPGGAA